MLLNPHKIKFLSENKEVYWATIQYIRHWLAYDGPQSFEARRTGMTPALLRQIAIRYNVMRGFVGRNGDEDRDTRALRGLCDLLNTNKEAGPWPNALVERAEICNRLAVQAENAHYFRNNQISAITKFMWFVRPNNWTVFDRFAADALGIQNINAQERMSLFYNRLQNQKLSSIWRKMQSEIKKSSVP